MSNLVIGIISAGLLIGVLAVVIMLIKKQPITKSPTNNSDLWSDKQTTELERIVDNTFGIGSSLIPPSTLFTDEIKKCILDKMKLKYNGNEFEFMAANDINPDPNINTISNDEIKFLLYMNKCASECFGYEWGKNQDDPIFNDETLVNSTLIPGMIYKDINCAINLYKTKFSKLELKIIDFLSIIPETESDPVILKDYRKYKNDILNRCLDVNKPPIEEITFDTKPPGVDKYSMFMSETITPMAVQPVNPQDYPTLILPSYFNEVNNLNKVSLFKIGNTELSGIINSINISGTFNIPDFNTFNSTALYTIIILPPDMNSPQQNFTEDTILKSAVIQPQTLNNQGNYSGDFSKSFPIVGNNNLEKNSDILLYVVGFNVVLYDVKIVLKGAFI